MSGHTPFSELRQADSSYDRPDRRARRAAMAQAMRDAVSLAELRESRGLTQEQIAQILHVSQANISRVEREQDIYLSTLLGYVDALGGRLRLVAEFPDQALDIVIVPA